MLTNLLTRGAAALSLCAVTLCALWLAQPYLPTPNAAAHHAPHAALPSTPAEETPESPLPDNPVDFAALQAECPEAVAWITVPDTNINYAVMQSGPNTPEDFYLIHNEKGEAVKNNRGNYYGSIYMQKCNSPDFTDRNTILYGHNMSGGKMFADLHKFKKKDFFEEHSTLYVYTPGHVLTYRIYSLFTFDTRHLMLAYDLTTDEGYSRFLDKTLRPNASTQQVREGVSPTVADHVITLSTCLNYGEGRLLLVAVLESDMWTK